MTKERAVKVLRDHNEWRRHDGEPCNPPHSCKELGEAIDFAVKYMEDSDDIN